MEIEKKYLIHALPDGYSHYPCHEIEQAYLCTDPVVRIRQSDHEYYLTYKSKGLMVREEYNLPLSEEAYRHLLAKADGVVLKKRRYCIPLSAYTADGQDHGLTVELDIFHGSHEGLILAEVEFPDEEMARAFIPPEWFGEDVTFTGEYQNSRLSHSAN